MRSGILNGSNVAVIVTTYNRPAALAWVLASLANQTVIPAQIVIADDGSSKETRDLIESWDNHLKHACPRITLTHAWQEDTGFRAAAVRNLAVKHVKKIASPQAIIFLDGDCITPRFFVENHLALLSPKRMVAGGRGLLSSNYTNYLECLAKRCSPADLISQLKQFSEPYKLWRANACDRYLPMRDLNNRIFDILRDLKPRADSAVRTCNLSLWHEDFENSGGFNEAFQGWGMEDTDLAVRLISNGVSVRSGRYATNVFHLWHPERSRSELELNIERLERTRKSINLAAESVNP